MLDVCSLVNGNSMYGNSMGQDPYQAVQMLEEKLKNTSDPAMRDHLTKTINILNNER